MITIVSPFDNDFGFSMKTSDDYANVVIFSQEMELLHPKAIQKRRMEFCLGRGAAHSALRKINLCNIPVLKGRSNEPLWPEGVVGAISHSNGVALAAVTTKNKAAGIGIDIEIIDQKMHEDIAAEVCTKQELAWVNINTEQKFERMLMIFSAKESIFKAFFPIVGVYFDFFYAELVWDRNKEIFLGRLLKKVGEGYDKGYTFEVGCDKIDNYIFTFMKLPPVVIKLPNT